jgi:hypothetical protein
MNDDRHEAWRSAVVLAATDLVNVWKLYGDAPATPLVVVLAQQRLADAVEAS